MNSHTRSSITRSSISSTESGFSLLELMITIAISSIIMVGVVQMSATNSTSRVISQNLAKIQESARFSLSIMGTNLRRAGYQGCSDFYVNSIDNDDGDPATLANTNDAAQADRAIRSTNRLFDDFKTASLQSFVITAANTTNWAQTSPMNILSPGNLPVAVADTDAVGIIGGSANYLPLRATMGALNDNVVVGIDLLDLLPGGGQHLMISSCNNAGIFTSTGVTPGVSGGNVIHTITHGAGSNIDANLNGAYSTDDNAFIHLLEYNTYYIGQSTDGNSALFKASMTYTNNVPTLQVDELFSGVTNMRVLYGQRNNRFTPTDQSDDLFRFVAGDDPDLNMDEVESIRIALLMASPSNLLPEDGPRRIELLDKTVDIPADQRRRMYRVFTSTVKIRNRAPVADPTAT